MTLFSIRPEAPILIVDDEFLVLWGLKDVLEDLGFQTVCTAATTKDGLSVLREQRPAFAFLDINLGGQNSFALARALQSADVPFAFVTGYGRSALEGEFADVTVLSKPLNPAELATVVAVAET